MAIARWMDISCPAVLNKYGAWKFGEPKEVTEAACFELRQTPGFEVEGYEPGTVFTLPPEPEPEPPEPDFEIDDTPFVARPVTNLFIDHATD